MRRMAPTNIMVAGGMNRQDAGEWVGNLLWWGGMATGIVALCVALVWATQEEWVVFPTGRHQWVPNTGLVTPG
jgi:hypothetical protein